MPITLVLRALQRTCSSVPPGKPPTTHSVLQAHPKTRMAMELQRKSHFVFQDKCTTARHKPTTTTLETMIQVSAVIFKATPSGLPEASTLMVMQRKVRRHP